MAARNSKANLILPFHAQAWLRTRRFPLKSLKHILGMRMLCMAINLAEAATHTNFFFDVNLLQYLHLTIRQCIAIYQFILSFTFNFVNRYCFCFQDITKSNSCQGIRGSLAIFLIFCRKTPVGHRLFPPISPEYAATFPLLCRYIAIS